FQAGLVRLRRRQFPRVPNQRSVRRFGVLVGRTMARLTSLSVPSAFLLAFHHPVWALLEGVGNVLVTCRASFRADASRRVIGCFGGLGLLGFRSGLLRRSQYAEPQRRGEDRDEGRRTAALHEADHWMSTLAAVTARVPCRLRIR